MTQNIIVRGARMHNLKNINVEIPRDKLTVVTGVSGSGKSSLAFDTIYAEGQRRYVESLSTYARQFLQMQEKAEVDSIEGLSPAISIDQKSAPRNPRSTVGTVTEMYDYLRLLYSKTGTPINPENGRPLKKQTPGQILNTLNEWKEGEKFLILAPLIRGKKGEHKNIFAKIQKAGFVRMRIDGHITTINEDIELDPNKKHNIEIVIDRLVKTDYNKKYVELKDSQEKVEKKNDDRLRVLDSIETALKFGEGILIVHRMSDEQDFLFSEYLSDPETGFSFPPIEPRLFSFNSPHGACGDCHGLGYRLELDQESSLNPNLSIREGGILPWSSLGTNAQNWYFSLLTAIGEKYGFSIDKPIEKIQSNILEKLFHGFGDEEFTVSLRGPFQGRTTKARFEGLIAQTEKRYNESDSDFVRRKLNEFMVETTCTACEGARLSIYGRNVFIGEKNISDVSRLAVPEVREWVTNLPISRETEKIIKPIQKELQDRLTFLEDVGLGYLSLSRAANTLSGGEAQRIRLATQIGSQLQGVLYVLDEPSIGLHQRDNDRLIHTLKRLRDLGNTVIVVEHDEDTMRSADHIIEIGPRSGLHGGELVYSGSLKQMESVSSETADFLFGRQKIEIPHIRRRSIGELVITGARENNLKNLTVSLPLGVLVGVTGVSGSGKSSLINRILVPTLARELNRAKKSSGKYDEISGIEQLDKLISIDQTPIGRTPRSNPATYTGVFTDVRDVFVSIPEARVRGYSAGRFSFNVKGGRCEACSGDGIKKIEMHFLPDVYVPCEVCQGKRYNEETLEITYRGKSIADVLDMTVEEAVGFFENFPQIQEKLQAIEEVGLGYIRLGQSATTLSGGEAQRVKLATELMKKATGNTIYVLDEPTTGLHFSDVKKLLNVLQKLVDKGNSVIIIEHNLDVIKSCDHLIDLGPEGGHKGGEIIATGTPEEVAKNKKSYTGQFLQKIV
ncbi:excinuclease ABC subunit UvrA [Candidatus Gracilibacteria bacterium]|nr:excinuclease ABC subunit UvrA [Candidatus Gracilibacteria bacterium]MCF7819336.1 excinuclease ABC subunit UvrA [Candidatus Gracilibacteria bacterium]